jgi:hypothetical protein
MPLPRALAHHGLAPWPSRPAVPFPQVNTFLAALDYALSCFHACVDRAEAEAGARRARWSDAAMAYLDVYQILTQQVFLPHGFLAMTRDLLARANAWSACAMIAGDDG